ncbi:MAG: glycosyltransferase family 4 protein [Rhodothalassiaceae bacterium]
MSYQDAEPVSQAARMDGCAEGLRVALFSGNYNYIKDGAAITLNRLVAFLEAHGAEVLVFSPTTTTPAFEPAGTLVSVPSVPVPRRSEYRISLGLPRSARERLAAFQPHLFHVSAPDYLNYSALRLAERWGIPSVASYHTRYDTYLEYYGIGGLAELGKLYLRRFYRRCQHIYVPTPQLIDVLRTQGIRNEIRLWSRGVDCSRFNAAKRDLAWRRARSIADDELVITFCGRLVLEKGLEVFAEVVELLQARGQRFKALVIGDGPERERMQARLPDAVFAGFLHGDDLARAYASADIFVNPSVTETFGNVTLEAMASGLPAVCADATGAHSLVVPGQTGYLVEPKSPQAYAERLEQLFGNDHLRREMSIKSIARAQGFDWDIIMYSLVQHYRDAIQSAAMWQHNNKVSGI